MKKLIFLFFMIPAVAFGQLDTTNVGASANDGTGETLRSAFFKVNDLIQAYNTYVYGATSNLQTQIGSLLLKSDTASMLSPYLRSALAALTYAPLDGPSFTTSISTPTLILNGTTLTATAAQLNYVDIGSSLTDLFALKAPLANAALTGSTTAANLDATVLSVGGGVSLDSITSASSDIKFYDGSDTLAPYIPVSARSTDVPLVREITENAQTGTTYTLVLTDAAKRVTCTNEGAITLTVPPYSSVAFPVGTQIIVEQWGAGAITFAEGSGVTINSLNDNLTSQGQYAVFTLVKDAEDVWILAGPLE